VLDASDDMIPSVSDLIEPFIRKRGIKIAEQALAKVVGMRSATALPVSSTSASFATLNGKQDSYRECLCHELHRWRECPHLNKRVRKPDWTPDKAISDEIAEKRA